MQLPPGVGFLFIFIICAISAEHDQQQVKVKPGQSVSLKCSGPGNAAVLIFLWRRSDLQPDSYLLFYRENRFYENYQDLSFRGRVRDIGLSAMMDGNFSVVLQNVSIKDSGTYECLIKTMEPGGEPSVLKHSINLTVSGEEQPEKWDRGHEDTGDGNEEDNSTVILVILAVSISTVILFYGLFFINVYVMNHRKRV